MTTDSIPEERVSFHEDCLESDEEISKTGEKNTSCPIIDVTLVNKHPTLQGFGLDISGGTDRPYMEEDSGLFISALKLNGLAEKSGKLDVGDKILKVNGESVLSVKHDEAVRLFISDRTQVSLQVKKNYGPLLRAASVTSLNRSVSTEAEKQPSQPPTLSITGFFVGVAVGCLCVVLLRRYVSAPRT